VNEIFEKSPEMQNIYYHHYRTVNIKNTQKQIKGLEFVFIELPKFRPQSHGEKKLHELWLRFLTEINERTREVPAELLENCYTQEAIRYMEISAYTKEQLFTYDKFRDGIMTERSIISDAWHKVEETGLQKGRKEGLQEGRKEGLQEGRKEGEKEGIKKVALNLLQMGIPMEDIIQSTRLTEDEIRMLR
jgi:predicted transposase/invertase (TIGR01784 family)